MRVECLNNMGNRVFCHLKRVLIVFVIYSMSWPFCILCFFLSWMISGIVFFSGIVLKMPRFENQSIPLSRLEQNLLMRKRVANGKIRCFSTMADIIPWCPMEQRFQTLLINIGVNFDFSMGNRAGSIITIRKGCFLIRSSI